MSTPPRTRGGRGLVSEVATAQRATVMVLAFGLLLSLATSVYLIGVTQHRLTRATAVARESRLVYEGMLTRQSALLGWVATGDDHFLAPDDADQADAAAGRLVDLLRAEPALAAEVTEVLVARDLWSSWATGVVETTTTADSRSEVVVSPVMLEGRRLFDAYRDAQLQALDDAVRLRSDAIEAQRVALIAASAANALLLGSTVVATAGRSRGLARRVREPVEGLLDVLDALRAGRLSVRATPSGLQEIDEIGVHLGELASALEVARADSAAREARVAQHARQFELLLRLARSASGSESLRYTCEAVAGTSADLLGTATELWLADDDGVLRATRRSGDAPGVVPPSDLRVPRVVREAAADARPAADGTTSAFPVVLSGRVVGVLSADGDALTDALDGGLEDVEAVLDALLSTAAAAIESTRLHSSARELAHTDALTRLPNRRRMDADLADEWHRSVRYGRPFCLLMIDLDHFKRVNDELGHATGDAVLRAVADALHAGLRATDTAYRYGGEELAVLLRETSVDAALVAAAHVADAVRSVCAPGLDRTLTASVGVAAWEPSQLQPADLLEAADAALYQAKREGRDRVVGPLRA